MRSGAVARAGDRLQEPPRDPQGEQKGEQEQNGQQHPAPVGPRGQGGAAEADGKFTIQDEILGVGAAVGKGQHRCLAAPFQGAQGQPMHGIEEVHHLLGSAPRAMVDEIHPVGSIHEDLAEGKTPPHVLAVEVEHDGVERGLTFAAGGFFDPPQGRSQAGVLEGAFHARNQPGQIQVACLVDGLHGARQPAHLIGFQPEPCFGMGAFHEQTA